MKNLLLSAMVALSLLAATEAFAQEPVCEDGLCLAPAQVTSVVDAGSLDSGPLGDVPQATDTGSVVAPEAPSEAPVQASDVPSPVLSDVGLSVAPTGLPIDTPEAPSLPTNLPLTKTIVLGFILSTIVWLARRNIRFVTQISPGVMPYVVMGLNLLFVVGLSLMNPSVALGSVLTDTLVSSGAGVLLWEALTKHINKILPTNAN